LLDRAPRRDEEFVAAGSVARAAGNFFGRGVWALAYGLGLWGDSLCLTLSIAMALALVPSALLAVVAGAVTLGGLPASPLTGSLLAVRGTVARLGPGGSEPAFAALEQAAATATMRTPAATQESLTRRTGLGIV
jgi:hypothetical protein